MATLPDSIKSGQGSDDGAAAEEKGASSPTPPVNFNEVGSPTTPDQESREMPPPREPQSHDEGYAPASLRGPGSWLHTRSAQACSLDLQQQCPHVTA